MAAISWRSGNTIGLLDGRLGHRRIAAGAGASGCQAADRPLLYRRRAARLAAIANELVRAGEAPDVADEGDRPTAVWSPTPGIVRRCRTRASSTTARAMPPSASSTSAARPS